MLGRDRAGITQAELAEKSGLCLQTVSRSETGRAEPLMENMVKMCLVLNIPLDEIVESYREELREIEERLRAECPEKD